VAGTTGGSIRAEALQVRLVRKGESFDRGGYDTSIVYDHLHVSQPSMLHYCYANGSEY